MNVRAILAFLGMAGLTLCVAGCGQNDLGSECTLTRPVRLPDGGTDYREIPPEELDAEKDYVSRGLPGCENFTCVKSQKIDQAYCSKNCLADDVCGGGVSDTLVCRELVLDQEFIDRLREQLGEEEFREVFGDIDQAKFCAEPPVE